MTKKKDSEPIVPIVEPYGAYKMLPILDKIILQNWQDQQDFFLQDKQRQQTTRRDMFGVDEPQQFTLNPSTASMCVRKEGYRAYDYKPEPPPLDSIIVSEMGAGSHRQFLSIYRRYLESETEVRVVSESPPMSGRLDLLVFNPKTKEYQIIDLKFIGVFPFQQIKREGLPKELLSTKAIYQPTSEYENQILYYVWAERGKGRNVTCANIIYFDRGSGKRKESLIPWDARAQERVANFINNVIKPAEQIIREDINKNIDREQKRLPEPSVVSDYLCGYCSYLKYCLPGRQIVSGHGIKRVTKPRAPRWVAVEARKKAEEVEKRITELQTSQPKLF